ncbi:hypothetical protein [Streptomyces sp. WZ-12]|uniref:hypothetical protein n=1 Tax=Streptomyces sp. WZ-12 TaxID=3030210 RepID=UPI0023815A1D|nr:hypothetical protein [Streptomyces sp. WZ-12]
MSALHGELAQSRLQIQEALQRGTIELRDENRELRSRQDRLTGELHATRSEFRQLLELADLLRAAAAPPPPQDRAPEDSPEHARNEPAVETPEPAAAKPEPTPPPAPATTAPSPHAEPNANQQAETMDNTEPQPVSGEDNQGREQDHALKKAIEDAYRGTATPAQVPAARPEVPQVSHGVLLLKAAGVASAELVAHRDTWEWISGLTVDHSHFRTPPTVQDVEQGRIQTVLSGRSLIALLIELWNTRHDAAPLTIDWAMATTSYDRIATEIAKVEGQGRTIRIVLDDGLPHSDD